MHIIKAILSISIVDFCTGKQVDNYSIGVIDKNTEKRRLQIPDSKCLRSSGQCSVLVIRVDGNDSTMSSTAGDLSNNIFGTNGKELCMKSQFSSCSMNKLQMIPFSGTIGSANIVDGVDEIHVMQDVRGQQAHSIVRNVLELAEIKYGDVENTFDFVMICLPPGTLIGASANWRGYGFIYNYLSVYNDVNANYVSVQMHEIGHCIGLSHSNDEVNYGDETGMMGISYENLDGPKKCFNAPKSWQLGWYSDSHFIVDIKNIAQRVDNMEPILMGDRVLQDSIDINVVGIGDYGIRGSSSTIIKIVNSNDGFDYFISVNHKSGITIDAGETDDALLITRQRTGSFYVDSFLMAAIKPHVPNSKISYYIYNYDETFRERLIVISRTYLETIPSYTTVQLIYSRIFCWMDSQCDDSDLCTEDTCVNLYSSNNHCKFSPKVCESCGSLISMELTTNDSPTTLTWRIENINQKKVIWSGGNYTQPNKQYSESKCLQYGAYKFTLLYDGGNTTAGMLNYSLVSSSQTVDSVLLDMFYLEDLAEVNALYSETPFTICNTDGVCDDYDGCTIDQCNTNTRLCEYVGRQDCIDCSWLTINITTDNFPEETTWWVQALESDDLVVSGDPVELRIHQQGRRSKPTRLRSKAPTRTVEFKEETQVRRLEEDDLEKIHYSACLANDIIYQFSIHDSFGDGICCSEGAGSLVITGNNIELLSGGDFGDSASLFFAFVNCITDEMCNDYNPCTQDKCLSSAMMCLYVTVDCIDCGGMVQVDVTPSFIDPSQTFWDIKNNGNIVLQGGPYVQYDKVFSVKKCLPFGSYFFTMLSGGQNSPGGGDGCFYAVKVYEKVIIEGGENELYDKNIVICSSDNDCGIGQTCDISLNLCVHCPTHLASCEECGAKFELSITTSDVPGALKSDGNWYIFKSGEVFLSRGPYPNYGEENFFNECLPFGSYEFNIFIISNPSYELKVGGQIIVANRYLDGEKTPFVICSLDEDCGITHVCLTPGNICMEIVKSPSTTDLPIAPSIIPFNTTYSMTPSLASPSPTDLPIAPTIFPFRNTSSMTPSLASSFMEHGDYDSWHLAFTNFTTMRARNDWLDYLQLRYEVGKNKKASQLRLSLFEKNCLNGLSNNVYSTIQTRVILRPFDKYDEALVVVKINYHEIRKTKVWKNVSDDEAALDFCIRNNLIMLEPLTFVSFSDTNIHLDIKTRSDFSTYDMNKFTVNKIKASEALYEDQFQVSSCICRDSDNSCFSEPEIKQNSYFLVCVIPKNQNLEVLRFERISLYQNGILKYSPIDNGIKDTLTTALSGRIGKVSLRLISTFFSNESSQMQLVGEVLLRFSGSRSLLEANRRLESKVLSFEILLDINPTYASGLKLLFARLKIYFFLVLFVLISCLAHRSKGKRTEKYSPLMDG